MPEFDQSLYWKLVPYFRVTEYSNLKGCMLLWLFRAPGVRAHARLRRGTNQPPGPVQIAHVGPWLSTGTPAKTRFLPE